MTKVQVQAMPWKMTPKDFHKKLRNFGLNNTNYMERLKIFPTVRISKDHRDAAYTWCQQNLRHKWIWSDPTQTDYTDIYFKSEADAIVFKLSFDTI